MSGTWWAKFTIIALAVLFSVYALTPTLVAKAAHVRLAEQAATVGGAEVEATEQDEETTWWAGFLPDTQINLGLDLQGGIDLTLQVEVEEAVLSTVSRDVGPLREEAEKEGLSLDDVRRVRGEPALMIRLSEGQALTDLQRFIHERHSTYLYVGTKVEDGADYHVFRLSDEQQEYIGQRAVEQALETLRNRVNETGVKEPSIVLKGDNRINVQLPGIDNLQQAVAAIGTTAVLQFMLVDEDADQSKLEKALLVAEKELDEQTYSDDRSLSDWLARTGRIPNGDRLIWKYEKSPEGKDVRSRPLIIKDEIMLTGDDINDAHVAMNKFNEPYVALEFKARGGRIFSKVTGENVGKRFAIVLDDKLRSAPVIREKIGGGRASIEMGAGSYEQLLDEASVLSLVLRTGALPAPVTIGEVRTVGSTLGADAIRSGVSATFMGGAMVLVFMLVFYRFIGLVADLALLMNVVFIMALLAAFGATLTLPGIAGIALTVGMAVDANIIIFERIREELRLGKNARSAVDAGFEKAVVAVLDANITTFIAGVVLFSYGTGPIKGFAVTLMIGIVTTLFSAIFVSRTLLDFLTRKASARLAF